jgi:carboxymethylenebutenolidase
MNSSTVDVETPDGVADCYVTRPDGAGTHPAVLLMIDAVGLRPEIEKVADRIAAEGYVVLAPNVFYRAGRAPLWETPDLSDPDAGAKFMGILGPLMAELTPDVVAADSAAYLDRLTEMTDAPVGITGYCMGGRLGWQVSAAHPERVAAFAGFHTGGMVTDGDDSPHLVADHVTAEVYWGHADHDRHMTTDNIATLDQAMDDAGVTHTTQVYKEAAHGFTMADLAAFDEAARERHFDALFALFGRQLSA